MVVVAKRHTKAHKQGVIYVYRINKGTWDSERNCQRTECQSSVKARHAASHGSDGPFVFYLLVVLLTALTIIY